MLNLQTKRWLTFSALLILTLGLALLLKMYGILTPSVVIELDVLKKNDTTVISPTTSLAGDHFYINSKIFETKSLGKIATKRTMQANMSFIGSAP